MDTWMGQKISGMYRFKNNNHRCFQGT